MPANPTVPPSGSSPVGPVSYRALETRFRDLGHLGHAQAMLGWDEAVMMPPGGGEARGEALATLAALAHARLAAPDTGEMIAMAEAGIDLLSPPQRLNLREMKRQYRDATALPPDLVRARQLAVTRCEQQWRQARAANDWQGVQASLGEVLARVREVAGCLHALDVADGIPGTPYDALLSRNQPGITAKEVDQIFGSLQVFLPEFLERARAQQPRCLPLPAGFPVARQKALGEHLMGLLGFDFTRGRLDVSHHPFSGGVPDDTRITTRYADDSFLPAQLAVLHETGHGLYQQGLPQAWRGQPLGEDAGTAVHESQSLLVEMQVARSKPFLAHIAPIVQEMLVGAVLPDAKWSGENLYLNATRVQPGYIRVDADEVTYPLHVILRFDLERRLLDGSLSLADLPAAWDASMRTFLGLSTGNNHRDGCMQDVHWFAGVFGYFPCYTLGALMAAQLFAAARRAIPDVETRIGRGDLAPLRDWLRANVHVHGRALPMQDLLVAATGERLDARHYREHLQRRYLRQAW